jgi:DNA-binding transcriptional LysR family regulator
VDLAKLKMFTQVAGFGSLTRAAVTLETTQSALSRRIAALEEECGGRLFHRTGRGVALTDVGKRLLPRVQALLADAERIGNEARTMAAAPKGDVAVGVLPSIADPLVPLLFRRARERFPGIRLQVLEGFSGEMEEWLASGRVEVATLLRYGKGLGYGERSLGSVDTCLVGPKGDAVTRPKTVKFVQLDGLPLILPVSRLRTILEQLARRKGIKLSVEMESNSIAIQNAIVAGGGFYTVSSYYSASRDLRAGILQASRIVNPSIDRTFAIRTTTQHPLSRAARDVAKLLREIGTTLSVGDARAIKSS